MIGNPRHGTTYYRCHPANNNRGRPDKHADHPPTVYMREDLVLIEISKLYAERVFGCQRRDLLLADLEAVDDTAQRERGEERQRLQRKLADTVRKQENVLSQAENADPNDPFTQGLRQRYNNLNSEREAMLASLATLDQQDDAEPSRQ